MNGAKGRLNQFTFACLVKTKKTSSVNGRQTGKIIDIFPEK
ncbi:hypothetical protein [Siminovitchia fortis]|nr:hypothetical protein [Siminovitchia fortis]